MRRSIILILFLFFSQFADAANDGFTGESPVSVVPETPPKKLTVTSATAVQSANSVVGLKVLAEWPASTVHYVDRSAFGPIGEGVGWLLRGAADVTLQGRSERLTMNIIVDGQQGAALVAYTDPGTNWVAPVDAPRNPEITTAVDGWVMGAKVPDHMNSTAGDVVTEAFRKFGLNFKSVGQIIVRPRWISAQYPAKKVGDRFVPLRPTEKVWLVQVCGAKFNETNANGRSEYQTMKVMQFRDGSLEYMGGVFAP